MQEKDIKRIVIKQLKTKFPFWWGLGGPVCQILRIDIYSFGRVKNPGSIAAPGLFDT
jgi:hypothetical protein